MGYLRKFALLVIAGFITQFVCAQSQDSTVIPTASQLPIDSLRRVNILKIGWIKNDIDGSFFDFSFEHSLKKHVSLQGDFGCFPYNRSSRLIYGSYFSFHIGLEGRFYYFLRKLPIDGFYIGPYIGYNQVAWFHKDVHRKAQVASMSQIGLTIGFQKVLFKHIVLGAGLKGGYCDHLNVKFYSEDGRFLGGFPIEQKFSLFSQLSFGYKF
ncbi:MAG: hypothetical protein RLZZ519_3204 [Bacteroidota bacterium]|jgi:hypothetical protein